MIYFLIEDSYSDFVFPYLKTHVHGLNCISLDGVKYLTERDILICSAKAKNAESLISSRFKSFGYIDSCHLNFKDVKIESLNYFNKVFSVIDIERTVSIKSLHTEVIDHLMKSCPNNGLEEKSILYISQPFEEDSREISFSQFDLCKKLQVIFGEMGFVFSIKVHPRDTSNYKNHFDLEVERNYGLLYQQYKYWVGYNSSMIYSAMDLGKHVCKLSQGKKLVVSDIANGFKDDFDKQFQKNENLCLLDNNKSITAYLNEEIILRGNENV